MPRLYAYGAVLLAVLALGFGAGWQVQGWRAGAREKTAVEAANKAKDKAYQDLIRDLRSQIRAAQESSNGYQAELTRLRNAAALEPVSVRVCKPSRSTSADLPRASTAPSRPDATSETGRLVPEHPADDSGRDIGPELAALADEADRCSAQLRALIDWVRRTSGIP